MSVVWVLIVARVVVAQGAGMTLLFFYKFPLTQIVH